MVLERVAFVGSVNEMVGYFVGTLFLEVMVYKEIGKMVVIIQVGE